MTRRSEVAVDGQKVEKRQMRVLRRAGAQSAMHDLHGLATELRHLSSDLGRLNPYRHNPEQILGAKQAISVRLRQISLQLVERVGR